MAVLSSLDTFSQSIGKEFPVKIEIPRSFPVQPLYKSDTLTILVCGDAMMHGSQIDNAKRADGSFDFSAYFSLIGTKIQKADIAICNMEVTFAGEPYSGYPCFSAPDEFAEEIARCGFDVFLCANNHIFDRGPAGADRTLEKYRQLGERTGIAFTGLAASAEELEYNTPLFIACKGIRIALLNFTYGTNAASGESFPRVNRLSDKLFLTESIAKAEESDFTLMLPHWGEEYVLTHNERQEILARKMIEAGSDMIIGAHPHVVQDHDIINGVHVLYSLGNLVSNMSARNTQLGMMATVRLIRDCDGDIMAQAPELTWLWCSRPGGYDKDDYMVIPIEEYIGRRDEWTGTYDYDKMVNTYMGIVPGYFK